MQEPQSKDPYSHADTLWDFAVQHGWIHEPMQLMLSWHTASLQQVSALRHALQSTHYVPARSEEWDIVEAGPLSVIVVSPLRDWERWQLERELLWACQFADE